MNGLFGEIEKNMQTDLSEVCHAIEAKCRKHGLPSPTTGCREPWADALRKVLALIEYLEQKADLSASD